MKSYGRNMYHWDQKELEHNTILNPHHSDSLHVRQIPSRPESVRLDEESLRSSFSDLSVERHPVQHPAGTNSDESLEASNTETSEEDIRLSLDSVHPQGHSGFMQHNGLRNGYPEQSTNPVRQSMLSQCRPEHMMQHMHPGIQQCVPHPSRQNLPFFHAPGHHHITQLRQSLSQPTPLYQHERFQRSQSFQHPVQNHQALINQQRHLDTGFQASTSDIGLQESLTGIAGPQAVHRQQSNHQRELPSPEGSLENSITEFNDTENKDSIPSSDCSYFVTMHPTYEDRMVPPKQQNGDRNRDRVPQQNPVPTSSNQATGNQTPGRTTSTQPFNTPAQTNSGQVVASPSTSPSPSQPKEVKVFITYATEPSNSNHTRTVVQISQTLLRNSIDVAVDVLEETIRSMSSSEWLDNNINQSDFLLICVSPGYRNVVEGQSTSSQSGYHETEKAVNTQYIYRRIHAEYIQNGSKNYRFIPVLVSGAKSKHIPQWLRDTRVFEWPKDYEDIIFRLFKKERFIKPKPGPPPKHTIELYSSYTGRKASRNSDKDNRSQTEPKKVG